MDNEQKQVETPAVEEEQTQEIENSEITLTPEDLGKAVSEQVKEQLTAIKSELKEDLNKQVEAIVAETLKKRVRVTKPEAKKVEDPVGKMVEDLQAYLTKFA